MRDKTEGVVRSSLVAALRAHGALVQPIESGSTGNGIPDVFIADKDFSAWCELKIGEVVGGEMRVTFRPGQRAWLREYHEKGGISVLHVYCNENRKNYFFHGNNIKDAYPFPDVPYNYSCDTLKGEILLAWIASLKETK